MPSRGKDGHRSDIRDTKNLLKNNNKNAREPVILTWVFLAFAFDSFDVSNEI